MGRHIMKWAKLNFVARHYDPYVQGHKGHEKNQIGPFHYVLTHMSYTSRNRLKHNS